MAEGKTFTGCGRYCYFSLWVDVRFNSDDMREFKFRAFDPEARKMIYKPETLRRVLYYEKDNGFHMGRVKSKTNGDWVQFHIMQWTGLFDKTGSHIWEGDIFRVEEQADDRMYYLVIHWIKEWCMFGCLTVGEYNDYLATGISALDEPMFWTYTLEDTDSQKFFLCGNVHQNPKLIEL